MLYGRKTLLTICVALAFAQLSPAAWVNLVNGKNIEGWEIVGEGFWNVMSDGTLAGQRDPAKSTERQCWLYSKKEYGEYDLHVEYWLRWGGNSGVSIRDTSRAQYAQGAKWDPKRTPSHIGYEIQIANDGDEYPTGSVYLFRQGQERRAARFRLELARHRVAQRSYPRQAERPGGGGIGRRSQALQDRSDRIPIARS